MKSSTVSCVVLILAANAPIHVSASTADGESLPRPRGFAVLAEHGPDQWDDLYIPEGWTSDRAADGSRVSSIVNTIMPPLTDEDRSRGYLVFRHHYCDQVLPETTPMPQDLNRPLSITATPGEYEPVSFCIRSLQSIRNLRVSNSALESDGARIPDHHVDLRIVRYMPRAVDLARKTYALRPVYLEKRASIDLSQPKTAQYWLTISIPRDQPAGTYRARIRIEADDVPPSNVALRVEVLPFHLEEPPTIFGMYHLLSGTWRSTYHHLPGAIDLHAEDMAAHGMNGVITYGTPNVVRDDDGLRIDFEKVSDLWSLPISFADQVRAYLRAGLNRHISWYIGDLELKSKRLAFKAGSPAYKQAYAQIVRAWESYREAQGWPEFSYHPHDEIDASDARTHDGAMHLQMFRDMNLKTMMTYIGLGDRRKRTLPLVDIANYAGDVFRAEFVDERRAPDAEIWAYSGSATYGLDPKGDRYFFGLFGNAIAADGVTQWAYQWPDPSWNKDAMDAPFKPLMGGGGPGHYYSYGTPDGLLNTIGFEGMREGIDDAKYIHTLRGWIDRALKSDRQPARNLAVRAQHRLDDLAAWTDINRGNIYYLEDLKSHRYETTCHKQPYAMTGADFDRIRGRWIADIMALRSALTENTDGR